VAQAPRDGTRPAGKNNAPGSHRFPNEDDNARQPARHNPADLEALQARIHALEERILRQTGRIERRATIADLDKLQLRMQRLEQNLNSELRAAGQREHAMLKMLNKPPLKTVASERLKQLWHADIPALMRWLNRAMRRWWLDVQPGWWPKFAAAWQESLDQARR
jgi:hypothetical protein